MLRHLRQTSVTSINGSKKVSARHKKIPTREWLVAGFAGATLAFTAWGFAGVPAWSLHTLLLGSALAFMAALCPVPTFGISEVQRFRFWFEGKSEDGGIKRAWMRLLRFPGFWFGLFFVIYVAIQAANPQAEVLRDERGWWVGAVQDPLSLSLPGSVRSAYDPMNAWRAFNLHLAAFLFFCALWAGLRHRRSCLILLWVLVLSGSAMAFVAMLQHFTGADQVLWLLSSANSDFWGSFFYRNQGAAYLNWIMVAAGVLYFYYARKCFERGRRSGPHFLLFGLVLLTAVSVGLALSRGGILFGAALLAAFILLAVAQQIRFAFEERTSIRATAIALLVLSAVVAGFLSQVDTAAVQERFAGVEATLAEAGDNQRTLATKATFEMGMARMWTGWGAGSFRYVFPMYQQKYPEIFFRRHVKHGYFGRLHWRYAHNDLVQFFAEYGIVGFGLQLLFILSLVGSMLRYSAGHGIALVFALVSLLAAVGHATVDFIFSSPAYWMAFIGLIASISSLVRCDAKRLQRLPTVNVATSR